MAGSVPLDIGGHQRLLRIDAAQQVKRGGYEMFHTARAGCIPDVGRLGRPVDPLV